MKKDNLRFICFVGLFSSLGLVFDLLSKLIGFDPWGAGGGISIAMVPIFFMAYLYGLKGGLATGFVVGSIQIIWGEPAGIFGALLDYVLPYTSIGLAGLFVNKIKDLNKSKKYLIFSLLMLFVCIIRIMWHTLSGIILYETAFWASLVYNAPYVLISVVICIPITIIIIDRFDLLLKNYF